MKKFHKFLVIVTMICLLIPTAAFANEGKEKITSIETYSLENGDIIEIIISETEPVNTRSSVSVKTGSKTVNYKNAAGSVMWYVKESGTFSYTGTTSKCESDSVTAASNTSNWKIASKSSSRSGNTATGKATGKLYYLGNVVQSVSRTVTVSCSATGVIY